MSNTKVIMLYPLSSDGRLIFPMEEDPCSSSWKENGHRLDGEEKAIWGMFLRSQNGSATEVKISRKVCAEIFESGCRDGSVHDKNNFEEMSKRYNEKIRLFLKNELDPETMECLPIHKDRGIEMDCLEDSGLADEGLPACNDVLLDGENKYNGWCSYSSDEERKSLKQHKLKKTTHKKMKRVKSNAKAVKTSTTPKRETKDVVDNVDVDLDVDDIPKNTASNSPNSLEPFHFEQSSVEEREIIRLRIVIVRFKQFKKYVTVDDRLEAANKAYTSDELMHPIKIGDESFEKEAYDELFDHGMGELNFHMRFLNTWLKMKHSLRMKTEQLLKLSARLSRMKDDLDKCNQELGRILHPWSPQMEYKDNRLSLQSCRRLIGFNVFASNPNVLSCLMDFKNFVDGLLYSRSALPIIGLD